MSQEEIDYILDAVNFIADHGWEFLSLYRSAPSPFVPFSISCLSLLFESSFSSRYFTSLLYPLLYLLT